MGEILKVGLMVATVLFCVDLLSVALRSIFLGPGAFVIPCSRSNLLQTV